LTRARHMLMKRSMPRIRAIPATGIEGITLKLTTSAMNDATPPPCFRFQ
jgi:hypothetical protein